MATHQLPLFLGILVAASGACLASEDWGETPIPVEAGAGLQWQLQERTSDDFNYRFSPTAESSVIGGKWKNWYINKWNGPGTTIWRHENVAVASGKLWIRATREPDENKAFTMASSDGQAERYDLPATRMGCISSVETVRYPAFIEARVKIANAVLASNVWMLSDDSTQEIDILEAYGGRGDDNRSDWFARRLHFSHHVFIRQPLQDYQPKDDSTWYTRPRMRSPRGEGYWTKRFYRFGVYWRDPAHLEYYLDGELVKTTSGLDNSEDHGGIDPLGYTKDESGKRTGLSKPMHLIINMEAQTWNAAAGRQPTDGELARPDDHTYLVDWVRVYKPIEAASNN
ncbi:MAG: beta-agarase [Planctomycetota bacterium]